jgi:ATP-binding cassette subfamily B protein/subfamily B ATP-binding cassette protein MsbA
MKNYRRALREAMKFWPSLLLAMVCSMMVAMLWGGNILGFYPILEVTLHGESVQNWMEREISRHETEIQRIEGELKSLPQEASLPKPLLDQKAKWNQDLLVQQGRLLSWQKSRPWIERFVPKDPFQTVAWIVAILMVSTLVKHFFLVINELLVGRAALDISRGIRQRIFEKALHLDRATYSHIGTSGFTAHIAHTAEGLSQGLTNTLGGAVREPLKIASCLAAAGFICWRLLLISMIVAPVVGFLLVWLTRRLKTISQRVLMRAGSFHEVMLESLGNLQTVQAYSMEQTEAKRFELATMDMRNYGLRFIFYTALTKPVIEFLGLGMLCTTIVGGAYLVLNQQTQLMGFTVCEEPLSVSSLLIFFGALIGASDPLRKLSAVYSSIYAGSVAADALYPLLDQPSLIQDPEHPLPLEPGRHAIALHQVTFGYRPEQPILRDVSLEIPAGSTIAIVGHNGTGKSTMISLLCRFYDPQHGRVTLGGVDLKHLKLDDLRRRIALVTQHTELFNETISYNIAYGTPGATQEAIEEASRQAHAHEFIVGQLAEGYQTRVGHNGQRLSGGQRQRIALARALLRDPEILILDEATSQIDMHSETLIRDSLSHHLGRRTMIIITHREKLLDLADVVYEVKDGQFHTIARPGSLPAAA